MKKFLTASIVLFIALTLGVWSQNIIRHIGFPNGTLVGQQTAGTNTFSAEFNPDPVGTLATTADLPNSSGLTFAFPPILDNNEGAVTFCYKADEIGLHEGGELGRIRIPVQFDPETGRINDLCYIADFIGLYANAQPNVAIFCKNGKEITTRESHFPLDTTAAGGWKKVWDGVYQHYDTVGAQLYYNSDQLDVDVENGIVWLNIIFDEPFVYTGGDLSFIFYNTSVAHSKTTSIFNTGWQRSFTYDFECFTTTDALVNNEFCGLFFAFSDHMIITYYDADDDPTNGVQLFTYDQVGLGTYTGWPTTNAHIPNMSLFSEFMLFGGTGAYPATPSQSIRPKIEMTFLRQMSMEDENITVEESTLQFTGTKPNGEPIDTMSFVAKLNVAGNSYYKPLKLKSFTFSTNGTPADVFYDGFMFYFTASADPNFEAVTNASLGTYNVSGSGSNEYTINFGTPITLRQGVNSIDIAVKYPTTNDCGDQIACSIKEIVFGDRVGADPEPDMVFDLSDRETQYTTINYNLVNLVNNDTKTINLCAEEGPSYTLKIRGTTFGSALTGTYSGYAWLRSRNGITWDTAFVTNHTAEESYTFMKSDTSYIYYKGVVVHPPSCNPVEGTTDYVLYTINYETTIKNANIEYIGGLADLDSVEAGTSLPFMANVEIGKGSAPNYRWQFRRNGGAWQDFETGGYAPIATYEVPTEQGGNYDVRLLLENTTGICQTSVTSNIVSFKVSVSGIEFGYVTQPKPKIYACEGMASLEMEMSYYGYLYTDAFPDDQTWLSCWQKDGVNLKNSAGNLITDRFLTLTNLKKFDAGIYKYKAYVQTVVTDPVTGLDVPAVDSVYTDGTEIIIVPTLFATPKCAANNYGMKGDQVIFDVATNLAADNYSNNDFRWHKHLKSGKDIELNDEMYGGDIYRGSHSNKLVVSNLPAETDPNFNNIFTLNGEYYYLKITGPCEDVNTTAIYLLQGEQLRVSNQLRDYSVCKLGEGASFSADADFSDITRVRYQWFYDGTEVTDNNKFTGANANTLTLAYTEQADLGKEIYCKVYLADKPNIVANTNKAYVVESEWNFVNKYPASDNFDLSYPNIINVGIEWASAPEPKPYIMKVEKLFPDGTSEIKELNKITPATTLTWPVYVTKEQSEKYDSFELIISVINECNEVVSAEWTVTITNSHPIVAAINSDIITNVSLSPNPTSDVVNLKITATQHTEATNIELLGMTGSRIATVFSGNLNIGKNNIAIDLSKYGLAPGSYIINISNSKQSVFKQIIFVR